MTGDSKLEEIIEESIELERSMARLYLKYSYLFPEDQDFWWQLHEEENSHEALLSGGKKFFLPYGNFPEHLLCHDLSQLKSLNQSVEFFLGSLEKRDLSLEEAFDFAIHLERSGSEWSFERGITSPKGFEKAFGVLWSINEGFRNHAERIYQRRMIRFDS